MAGSSGFCSGLVLVASFYATLFLFTFHEADEDVWGRMAVGRLVLTAAEFPYEDVFAYVPTKSPWVDHEWLAGVLFYGVYERFGGAGLVWLRAMLGVAAVALAYVVGARGARDRAAASTAALSLASAVLVLQGFNSVVRAQAFSFLLFALCWWLLETGGRRVWLIVPVSAFWASLHGGVVTGLALTWVYALCSRAHRRSLLALCAVAMAATLVNPYGVDYWSYLLGALSMPRPEILEWRSVALTPVLEDLHLKLAALVAVLVLGYGLALRTVQKPHGIVLVAMLTASWMHVRFAPFLALALVVTLPASVETLFEKGQTAFPKRLIPSLAPLVTTVLLLALFSIGGAVAWWKRDGVPRMMVPESRYPVSAVRLLERSGVSGRLAVYFNWGEYALYHLHPRIRVSIDGRYETVYPDDVVEANWDFTHGRHGSHGREGLLERYPADFALYPPDSGAARMLEEFPEWENAHRDDASVLYTNNQTNDGKRLKTSLVLIEDRAR